MESLYHCIASLPSQCQKLLVSPDDCWTTLCLFHCSALNGVKVDCIHVSFDMLAIYSFNANLMERRQVSLTCLLWKAAYKSQARFCPEIRGNGQGLGRIKGNRWAQFETGAKNSQRGGKWRQERKVWNFNAKILFSAKRLVMGSPVKKLEESKSSKECTKCTKAGGPKLGQELMIRLVNCATWCFVPADKNLKNVWQKRPWQVGTCDAACTILNNFQESRCASVAVTYLNLAGISVLCKLSVLLCKDRWSGRQVDWQI